MKKDISSLHIPHNKNTAGLTPVRIDTPKEVVLPMNITSHAMNASKPEVSVGDYVRVGQVVASEEGRMSELQNKNCKTIAENGAEVLPYSEFRYANISLMLD